MPALRDSAAAGTTRGSVLDRARRVARDDRRARSASFLHYRFSTTQNLAAIGYSVSFVLLLA